MITANIVLGTLKHWIYVCVCVHGNDLKLLLFTKKTNNFASFYEYDIVVCVLRITLHLPLLALPLLAASLYYYYCYYSDDEPILCWFYRHLTEKNPCFISSIRLEFLGMKQNSTTTKEEAAAGAKRRKLPIHTRDIAIKCIYWVMMKIEISKL